MMDDGEVDSPPGGGLLDINPDPYSLFDDWETLIGTQICSHKHICNPTTGPDNTHTHTCEHTHTHTIGSGDDEKLTKKRRPSGNKEAVRKYREKQKAVKVNLEVRNAELEKDNQRIPELQKENARLRRKLQEQGPRQVAVEHLLAENKRLRGLLSQLRRSIDSELEGPEDVSYQKLLFTASKVDRGETCAAPVPCFPARPVAHHHSGGSADDLDPMERSLGWHSRCELRKKVSACHCPQEEFDGADVGSDHTGFGVEVTTPSSNAGTSSLGCTQRPSACSSKSATAAQRQIHNCGQAVAAPSGDVAYQREHPGAVPCPVAALPLPCFNNSPSAAVSSPGQVSQRQQLEKWQEDCDLVCGDAEMTADSSPLHSASLSSPEDMVQNANTVLSDDTPSPKKVLMEAGCSVDLFSPGCFYPDDVSPGPAAARWNQHLLPTVVSDGWLEGCDIIDGVCQTHLANAIENSCFGTPKEARHDSIKSAVALPPTICNQ